MSGSQIQREVAAGIKEAALATSDGGFSIVLLQGPNNKQVPWGEQSGEPEETELDGIVSRYPRGLVDGTLIRAEDLKVLLEATGPRPTVADKLRMDGDEYAIESIMDLSPGGVPLYYEVQARK
jgi:hypothetical protein